jgi:hypothetical protein
MHIKKVLPKFLKNAKPRLLERKEQRKHPTENQNSLFDTLQNDLKRAFLG